jgi:maleate cis-trans isomerase
LDFTIPGTLQYMKGIVILTGSQMQMRSRSQVDIYIFIIGGVVVSWRAHRQTMLAKSTMEAELVALESTTTEAMWLKEHLVDLLMLSCLTSTLFFSLYLIGYFYHA